MTDLRLTRQLQTSRWSQFIAMITNPDLITVVIFCTIGLLVALNLILHFPDFGAIS